jgi:Domain of unknown function (DUF4375)
LAFETRFFTSLGHTAANWITAHAAFFYNSEADNFPETVEALEKLDLSDFSGLLQRAAIIFFKGAVPRTIAERNAIIDELPEDGAIDDVVNSLDSQFYASGGGDRVLEALARWYFPA